ncbi:LAMI_0F16644g1_1 [Lachancea mirantina]|uniref:LAMI_0F16644g1_1 n=1 Tax=Lachancea mirantina TaxID=1230905 RepID=A0A1G4K518_9SACH|nr:LAMI_0F16644g1_1 [Lachancea mirantina]
MSSKTLGNIGVFEKEGQRFSKASRQRAPTTLPPVTQDEYTVHSADDYASIVDKMETYGLCVVKNFLSRDTCDQISHELEPHYYRDESWQGSPFPRQTTVVTRCALRSPTTLHKVIDSKLFTSISSHFLEESNYFWIGEGARVATSGIHLNSGIAYRVGSGAADQRYHREDMIHHTFHERRQTYHYGDDTLVGLGLALTEMSEANGATRAIIGSHLWGSHDPTAEYDRRLEAYLNVEKGDAVLMLGSLYHAASANSTANDRISAYFFMTKAYLRQEENLHLDTAKEDFRGLSLRTLGLLGLHTSDPFCGHIDYKSPAFTVCPELETEALRNIAQYKNLGVELVD